MNSLFFKSQDDSNKIHDKTEELKDLYSEHIWLKITPQDLEEAKANTRYYANQTGCNYALFNYLCVKLLGNWIKKDQGIESNNQLFSNDNNLARVWQFINGTVININRKRLILIPSDATDLEGFEVEEEWLDVPSLAGDYYLPVRVDLEINYLHIWGFISRKSLKETAYHDKSERLYIVDSGDVIDDLETLWMALELCEEKGNVQPLPTLTQSKAEALIETYSKPSPYSPRLKGNFQEWIALLDKEEWLKKLDLETLIQSPERPLVIFLEQLYQKNPAETTTKPEPVLARKRSTVYRSALLEQSKTKKYPTFPVDGVILDTQEKIAQAIQKLATKPVQDVVPANLESEDILLGLLLKGKKEISGQAAKIFWAIADAGDSLTTRQIRTLEIAISGYSLIITMAAIKTPNNQVALLLRISSQEEGTNLPQGLKLQWLSPDGVGGFKPEFKPARAQQQKYLQLYCGASVGENVAYEITLHESSRIIDFIV